MKKRVCEVVASLNPLQGGPINTLIGNRLDSNEFEATLLVSDFSNRSNFISGPSEFPLSSRYGISTKIFSTQYLKKVWECDILIVHGMFLLNTMWLLLISRASSRIFLIPHGSLSSFHLEKRKSLKKIFLFVVKQIIAIRKSTLIAMTEYERSEILLEFPDARVELTGIGVEIPENVTRAAFSKDEVIRLCCVNRITFKKRIDLSILSTAMLRDQGMNIELNIAGEGDLELDNELKQLVKELELQSSVHWWGHISYKKLEDFWSNMHILLLPSESENFAIAIPEAVVRGIPVVISSNIGLSNSVKKFGLGVVIETLSPNAVSDAVLQIIGNYDDYSQRCIDNSNNFSWTDVVNRWFRILNS